MRFGYDHERRRDDAVHDRLLDLHRDRPTNESNIIFFPPTVIPAPRPGSTITTNYTYCVTITAQPIDPNASTLTPVAPAGSITVAVADPLDPLR